MRTLLSFFLSSSPTSMPLTPHSCQADLVYSVMLLSETSRNVALNLFLFRIGQCLGSKHFPFLSSRLYFQTFKFVLKMTKRGRLFLVTGFLRWFFCYIDWGAYFQVLTCLEPLKPRLHFAQGLEFVMTFNCLCLGEKILATLENITYFPQIRIFPQL